MNTSAVGQDAPYWLLMAAGDGPSSSPWEQYVVSGGWITWFILIPLSVVMVYLVIHYLVTIRRATQAPVGLAKALVSASRQGQVQRILEITREDESMLGTAAFTGVSQLDAGRESARAAIEEAVEELAAKLYRRIESLNVIGNVSPMVGLFGTVVGMIRGFARIGQAAGGMPEPGKLAGDIAIALVTTFWGLVIAIPALSFFALFRNRIDLFAAECVKLCDQLITVLSGQTNGQAAVPRVTGPPARQPAKEALTLGKQP